MEYARYYFNDKTGCSETLEQLISEAKEISSSLTEEKFDNFVMELGYYPITENRAKSFYKDLLGTIKSTGNIGTLSVRKIADAMETTFTKANAFLWACADFGITERQGGAWVI